MTRRKIPMINTMRKMNSKRMTANELLRIKLILLNIHVDVSKIVLDSQYQLITEDYELFQFGSLSPIFASVDVDVFAGLGIDEKQLYIRYDYSWIYKGGGSNGYRVIESYEINPVIEETTDGC